VADEIMGVDRKQSTLTLWLWVVVTTAPQLPVSLLPLQIVCDVLMTHRLIYPPSLGWTGHWVEYKAYKMTYAYNNIQVYTHIQCIHTNTQN